MSKKKNTGLLIALGAVLGAAAAGISYYLKYKSFNEEIDKDFHDYEEDAAEEANNEPVSFDEAGRTYITIGKTSETEASAKETAPEETPTAKEDTPAAKEEAPTAKEETLTAAEPTDEVTEEPTKETSIAATVEEDTEGVN